MPIFMMKKVCIEQGFRLCFPDEMGGMPYGEEEVSYDSVIASEKDITPEPSNDDRQELKKLIENYEKELSVKSASNPVTPFDQCCEVLAENDPEKITLMLGKCKDYLSTKGFKVA